MERSELESLNLLDYYSKRFLKILVNRSFGIAPHKPILLISTIELIQRGVITENKIFLCPIIIDCFLKNWSYLGSSDYHPDISQPFFYMRSGKFWHLMPNRGFEDIISSKVKLRGVRALNQAIKYAYLDEDLFDLLQEDRYRLALIAVLSVKWFQGDTARVQKAMESIAFN